MDTKALRQKVLDLAIRGKLVPQDPNDEPASVLLERIRQQKQQMVKDGKLKAKDIKNDTIIFVGGDNLHYEKFADGSVKCIEDEIPFDLPDGWAWVRLLSIIEEKPTNGYSPKGVEYITNVRNLTLTATTSGFFKPNEFKYVDVKIAPDSKYWLRHNDILIQRSNSRELVGTSCIYDDKDAAFIYPDLMMRIHLMSGIDVRYIDSVLKSTLTREYYIANATGSAGSMPKINQAIVANTLIPLPPYAEQKRLVQYLDEVMNFTSSIETGKKDILGLISMAKAKILDLAIRGQLVPQDPDDEPASVLLERIRAEKEELVRQGKIKRDRKESVIFRGEDNSYYEKLGEKVTEYDVDELPYGWSVGSFSQVNMYASETINPSNSPDEMFELYSVPNFEADVPEIIRGKEIGSSKQSVCENDVLVCKINPRINRVWITGHITPYRLLGSSEWIVFRNHLLFAPYLRYYFSSPYFRGLMLSNVSGVGGSLMRAQPESVKKYPILIPPYQEQIRITERIDELFALLVAIEKSLS